MEKVMEKLIERKISIWEHPFGSMVTKVFSQSRDKVFEYRYSRFGGAPTCEINIDGNWEKMPYEEGWYIYELETPKTQFSSGKTYKISQTFDLGIYDECKDMWLIYANYQGNYVIGWGFTKESATDMAFRFLDDATKKTN